MEDDEQLKERGGNDEIVGDEGDDVVVTLDEVLRQDAVLSETANAVLGTSSATECSSALGYHRQALYACLTCTPASDDDAARAGVCLVRDLRLAVCIMCVGLSLLTAASADARCRRAATVATRTTSSWSSTRSATFAATAATASSLPVCMCLRVAMERAGYAHSASLPLPLPLPLSLFVASQPVQARERQDANERAEHVLAELCRQVLYVPPAVPGP